MKKPIKVVALPAYKLKVSFEDGTEGVVDLSSFINEGIFSVLKDENAFKNVYVKIFNSVVRRAGN